MKNNPKAIVKFNNILAGILEKTQTGYKFTYDDEFIKNSLGISLSLPINQKTYTSEKMFPFFKGLIPEGWYLDIVSKKLKIDKSDSFKILLSTCKDTIGAVSIEEMIVHE
ncbi:MAG: HipA N-terminal domain-containing protein [Candidatus Omnitrophota bacterium]